MNRVDLDQLAGEPERGDAEHHRDQRDGGDQEDEGLPLARQQIAAGDHPFIA